MRDRIVTSDRWETAIMLNRPTVLSRLDCRQTAAAAFLVAALCGTAEAQLGTRPVQGPARPTTSPYLNLLNSGGNSGGLNFFTQVRPQQQFRANERLLRQEVAGLQDAVEEQVTYDEYGQALLPQTGHPTVFRNQNGYFGTGPATSFNTTAPGSGLQSRPARTTSRAAGVPRTGAAVFNSYGSQVNRRPAVPGQSTY
jgi:hypothetical protein